MNRKNYHIESAIVVSSGFIQRMIIRNLKVATTLIFFLFSYSVFATTPHTITIDGDLSDWNTDELIYDDPTNDGSWGVQNQVDNLYLTWDNNNLYIGASGVQKDGNCFILYIDAGSSLTNNGQKFGDYSDVSQLKDSGGSNWWWARNHKFPSGFLPDYQLHLYEMQLKLNEGHGLFRYTTSSGTVSIAMSSSAYIGGGTGKNGSFEVAIPWSQIYPDYGTNVPQNATLQLVAVMSGGNDTSNQLLGSVHDSAPDQTASFKNEWYGQFTFDTWLTIPLRQNTTYYGSPDKNRSPVSRKLVAIPGDRCAILSWQKKGYWEKNLKEYKIYYKTTQFADSFSTALAISTTTTNTNITLTNLTNNQTYYFVLTAINTDGTESGCSEEEYCWIHGPTILHTPIERFSYPGKNITLSANIADSSGLSDIEFYYKPLGSQYYIEENPSLTGNNYSYTIPATSISVEGCDYYFRAKNKNGDTNISSSTIVIISTNSGIYSVEDGLELSLPDISTTSVTKIVIPPFALDKKIELFAQVKPISDIITYPVLTNFSDPYPVCVYEFYGLLSNGEKVSVSFKKELDIYLRYFDDDLNSGFSEDTLKPYLWTGKEWLELKNADVDTQNNFVSAKTGHLSKFAVFYTRAEDSHTLKGALQKVVRPKFIPDNGEVVEFQTNSQLKKIEIFDLEGSKIRKLEGLNYWDGKDETGTVVAGGVYIYQLCLDGETISGMCVVIK